VVKRKTPSSCQVSNHEHPAHSLVTTLTETKHQNSPLDSSLHD